MEYIPINTWIWICYAILQAKNKYWFIRCPLCVYVEKATNETNEKLKQVTNARFVQSNMCDI